jgi:peptide/nickel transport system permease protein
VRASVRDVLDSDYITLLEAQGFPRRTVLFRSALKCAAVPFTTVIGLQISHLLGGLVVVESIFDMPGLGWLAVRSVLSNDVPVMAGVAILVAALIMIVNLCVDLAHMVLDPRVVVA